MLSCCKLQSIVQATHLLVLRAMFVGLCSKKRYSLALLRFAVLQRTLGTHTLVSLHTTPDLG